MPVSILQFWTHFFFVYSYVSSSSSSDEVCSDGLGLTCPASEACQLSVSIGSSTPTCQASVPLSTWTSTPPSVSLSGAACVVPDGKKIGLLMTDPDAPNCANPKAKYWLHWLALGANLKVAGGKSLDFTNAETIASFAPPTPPKAPAGAPPFHRYQIFVFSYSGVKGKLTADGVNAMMKDRKSFSASFEAQFQDYALLSETEFRTKRD